jgi:peptidoglycan/xylan/chitin deacetylase (PgdA/CDA1 family)
MPEKQKNKNDFWIILGLILFVSMIVFQFFINNSQKQASRLPLQLFWKSTQNQKRDNDSNNPQVKIKKLTLPILMYHHVGSVPNPRDQLRKELTVSPEDFEKQVSWLKNSGYKTVSLENLLDFSKGKYKMPEKPTIFSFDDGYQDAFANAVPILKKYGFTGTFAVITQFPGIKYADNVYASWQEIQKAKSLGMEIISHTQDHFDGTNPKYTQKFIYKNLEESQADLKKNLNFTPLPFLIYPYGHYNSDYIQTARSVGFRIGLTTKYGKVVFFDKLMEVPRIRVNGTESLDTFKKLILE